ncbi:MAG: Ig-like domain-containing protein [Actinomycetota bacterium]
MNRVPLRACTVILFAALLVPVSVPPVIAAPDDLDPTFGGDGLVNTNFSGSREQINALITQSDGKTVAVGSVPDQSDSGFLLARYGSDGTLDQSFGGGDGLVSTEYGQDPNDPRGVVNTPLSRSMAGAIQSDGKIVVAGTGYEYWSCGGHACGFSTPGFALARYGSDGGLDPTFGSDGIVAYPVSRVSGGAVANALAIQPDGKIIAAGTSSGEFTLVRFHSNGTLDNSFGEDGKVYTPFADFNTELNALALQPDGRIVAAGRANAGDGGQFALARYETNGDLDATFGGTGVVTGAFEGGRANALAIYDGKIVAVGASANGFEPGFGLARYAADGSLDPTFGGGDGRVVTTFEGQGDVAHALKIHIDGKIVAAGVVHSIQGSYQVDNFGIARYEPDGDLDPTFGGGDGLVTTDFGLGPHEDVFGSDEARALRIYSDGRILAAGRASVGLVSSSVDFGLARYEPDGDLDPTFAGQGLVTTNFQGSSESANDMAIQPDGKIVAAGRTRLVVGGEDAAIARYEPDGDLDPTFGGDGVVTTDLDRRDHDQEGDERYDSADAVAIQTDGKIVVAGAGGERDQHDLVLARYESNGDLDLTFGGGDGRVIEDSEASGAPDLAIQPDGKIVVTVESIGTVRSAVARYEPDGDRDPTFGGGDGLTTIEQVVLVDALAIQPDGKIVVAGTSPDPEDFAVVRYGTDGEIDPTFGGGDGRVTTDFGGFGGSDRARALAIQPDGKLVVAGSSLIPDPSGPYAHDEFALARYERDGDLDPTFAGGDGILTADIPFFPSRGLAIQPGNRIVVAGRVIEGLNRDFALLRYQPNGDLDPEFGGDGIVTLEFDEFEGGSARAEAVGFQSDGAIVVVGTAAVRLGESFSDDFALARFEPDPGTAPAANADAFSTAEDTTLSVAAPGVLANDSDADNDPLTAVLQRGPTNATSFTLNGDGSFTYTPAANFSGTDSFTYKANDGGLDSDAATVTMHVTPVNDPPTVAVTGGRCQSDTSASATLMLTVGDVDSPPGSLTLTAASSNTALIPNANLVLGGSGADRTLSLSGVPRRTGTATITVTVSDGLASTALNIGVQIDGAQNTTLNGAASSDVLFGLEGKNMLNGLGGADLLCGGNAADTLNGGEGNDVLLGGRGNDILAGGEGNDILLGEGGNDSMAGQGGNDSLSGGTGADSFSGGPGTDTNTDFKPSQGDTQDGS